MKRLLSLLLSAAALFTLCLSASAAGVTSATIDTARTGSLTLYKYDLTTAEAEGLTDQVYLSTGKENSDAAAVFAPYAIPGVEFTYLRVGSIRTYASGQAVQVVYGVENAALLSALGLSASDRITAMDGTDYYASDTLIDALSDQLSAHNTTTKNAMEALVQDSSNAVSMPLTDSTGKTSADELKLGLYLVVETKVPEDVTATVDPFLVSLPMTDTQALDNWFYDVTAYPKNQTGAPTLEKEVADAAHGLSFSAAENSYEDVATASQGDVLNYRIRSTLPQITSDATRLTRYEFVDILSGGIQYRKGDVKVCWYQDAATAKADYTAATEQNSAVNGSHADLTWDTDSDYFSVRYGSGADNASTMTVTLTEAGLAQVNTAADGKNTGHYSGWTMVIYYSAIVSSDASVVVGDAGNPNEVTLTWSRTTDGYYDTLTDRARVYTYGIDLTKVLAEGGTDFDSVQFLLENTTNKAGSFYLLAEQAEDGVYYITGSTAAEADATRFCPSAEGKLLIYGLEEDSYRITEVKTASGYTLLKDPIDLVISTDYTADPTCGSLTASATVNGAAVSMEELGDSGNAHTAIVRQCPKPNLL